MNIDASSVMRIVPVLVTTAGILIAALSLPLVQGKVAPNAVYGIRTKLAFSSEENWYRVNKFGGKIFFIAALIIAAVGLIGLFLPGSWLIIYSCIAAVVTLVAIIGSSIIVLLSQ